MPSEKIYCKCEISDGRVMEVCDECGKKVWGEKMFNTIVKNMNDARDSGDLCHMNNTCNIEFNSNLR